MAASRSAEHLEDEAARASSKRSRTRVSDEQIHSSACGSAIEINYDDDSRPIVNPFSPEWAFGSRPGCRVLNLSSDGRGLVAYSNAHAVVLYDYKNHGQRLLLGHRNAVAAMAVDATGSWLVSVDAGTAMEPSCAMLWNLRDLSLQRVLPGQPPEQGYQLVAMSPDAQLVAAVSAGPRRTVSLWGCGGGGDVALHAVLDLPPALGAANAVAFSQDEPGLLMVTCSKNVAFMAWAGGALQLHPGQLITKCPGKLLDSIYQRGTANAVTVSARGFVILWTEPPVYAPNAKLSRKVYCIEKDGLTTIVEVDGMAVVGTSRGHVRFYDQDMCLLHWYQQGEPGDAIAGLSFCLDPGGPTASRTSFPRARLSVDAEQRAVQRRKDLSQMISGPLPRGCDPQGRDSQSRQDTDAGEDDFQARDFIVTTARGRMVLVSLASRSCVLLQDQQAAITVIQTHTSKPQLLIGRANGSVSLIDYEKKEVMVSFAFECKPGAEPVAVTSLKYSPNGAVLACGRANGALYLLHPVLLHPVTPLPFHKTRHAIRHLCFSSDNMFMAHCDGANFVSAYRCHNAATGRWVYLGKKQLHGLPVRCVLFGPEAHDAPLYSIGEDLLLVEYDVAHSMNNTLLVQRMDKVEQSGVPWHMTWCPGQADDLKLLIPTSEYKYKLVDLKSRSLCGTYQGPRLRAPVGIMKTIGGAAARAPATAVFATQRHMGLQSLPPDGNPYTNVGMIVHPVKVMNFVISACEEFVFSCGEQDHSVFMWRVNPEAVEAIHAEDGEEALEPWLLSVEGGRDGWQFGAMQDMFCLAQLLHQGTFSTEPRHVGDRLAVCEVPDVLRALGYFPSQFEINTLVREVLLRCGESLTSSDLVRMLVNYKPSQGVTLDALRDAFAAFAFPAGQDGDLVMTKDKFLSVLLDRGEALDLDEAADVLQVLLKGEAVLDAEAGGLYTNLLMDEAARREKLFYFLPETISFNYLVETILGVVKKSA